MGQQQFDTPGDALAHFGVKGMKWGQRKARLESLREEVHTKSAGLKQVSVKTKTGETISVVKDKPGNLALRVGKLTGRKPPEYVSAMSVIDSKGKKVGSFQLWREDKSAVRGEWLEIDKGAQGRGYSKAALSGLIKAADKDPSITEIRLQVPVGAAPAKSIYGGLGFKPAFVYGGKDGKSGDPNNPESIEEYTRQSPLKK